MSGKTARRLRKEKANRLASGKHDNLQTKALGAAAATMLAISIAPTIAQAETSSPAVSTDSATVAVAATATQTATPAAELAAAETESSTQSAAATESSAITQQSATTQQTSAKQAEAPAAVATSAPAATTTQTEVSNQPAATATERSEQKTTATDSTRSTSQSQSEASASEDATPTAATTDAAATQASAAKTAARNAPAQAATNSTPTAATTGFTVTDASAKTITVTDADGIQKAIDYIGTQQDKTGWTINLQKGSSYSAFNIRRSIYDGLTVDGHGATVKVFTDKVTPYTGNTTADDTTQAYYGVVVQSPNVTLRNIVFDMGTHTDGLWKASAICASNGKTTMDIANNLTVENCTFNGSGVGNGIMTDNKLDTYTVKDCTFKNLVNQKGDDVAGCGIYTEVEGGLKKVNITGNKFENCSFAWHGSWDNGDKVTPNSGTFEFTNNEVTGTKDLRNKVVVQDTLSNAPTDVTIKGNTLTHAMIGTVNLTLTNNSNTKVNDVKGGNTYNEDSYYTEACWYKDTQGKVITYDVFAENQGTTSGYWTYDEAALDAYAKAYNVSAATIQHMKDAIEAANKKIAAGGSVELVFGKNEDTAEVFTLNKNAIIFKSYDPVEVKIKGTKVLKGATLKGGEFTFQLLDENGKVLSTATNAADGSITFKSIYFKKIGTYRLMVREVKGNAAGITYDDYPEVVTINVGAHYESALSDKNKLVAAVVTDDSDDKGIVFQNAYATAPVEHTTPAKQTPAAPKQASVKPQSAAPKAAAIPKTGDTTGQTGILAGLLAALGIGSVATARHMRKDE
jgi:pilin isopeptide linkage protein